MYQKKVHKYHHAFSYINNKNKQLKKLDYNQVTKFIKKAFLKVKENHLSHEDIIIFNELIDYKKKN